MAPSSLFEQNKHGASRTSRIFKDKMAVTCCHYLFMKGQMLSNAGMVILICSEALAELYQSITWSLADL